MTKFIFITGGVVSNLGKGITAASLGCLLKSRGLRINMMKLDPYINLDPGTMSPLQHGEIFVTEDGAETDLDLGHYERFIDVNLDRSSNVTAGQIYWSVISKERRGEYLGRTVQVIPHVTHEIKQRIRQAARDVDIMMVEIGGTVGDIESLPFLEAIRQIKRDLGRRGCLYIHVTLVPHVRSAGELKTKPTQHSVKELRSIGIQPDVIVCRSERPLSQEIRDKIALFCDIEPEAVIPNVDVDSIYEVPLLLGAEGLDSYVLERLGVEAGERDLAEWRAMVERIRHPEREVDVAIVGQYASFPDAYLSVAEGLTHGGAAQRTRVTMHWIHPEEVERRGAAAVLGKVDGLVVPGGAGDEGAEGIVEAIRYAREQRLPFLGIGLGMQLAAVEAARHCLGLKGAHSTEFDPHTPEPVVVPAAGGPRDGRPSAAMQLGTAAIVLREGTLVHRAYGQAMINERHRHRYEVSREYWDRLREAGLVVSGTSLDGRRASVMERTDHPWFVASQFHPEWTSRPLRPHPLFSAFVGAVIRHRHSSLSAGLSR